MGVEPMNKRSSPMVVVSAWCCNFNTRPVCYTYPTTNILLSYLSVHTFYLITHSITMLYWFWLHKYYCARVFIVNMYQEGGWDVASLLRPCMSSCSCAVPFGTWCQRSWLCVIINCWSKLQWDRGGEEQGRRGTQRVRVHQQNDLMTPGGCWKLVISDMCEVAIRMVWSTARWALDCLLYLFWMCWVSPGKSMQKILCIIKCHAGQ